VSQHRCRRSTSFAQGQMRRIRCATTVGVFKSQVVRPRQYCAGWSQREYLGSETSGNCIATTELFCRTPKPPTRRNVQHSSRHLLNSTTSHAFGVSFSLVKLILIDLEQRLRHDEPRIRFSAGTMSAFAALRKFVSRFMPA
jgi:hypothetical protein